MSIGAFKLNALSKLISTAVVVNNAVAFDGSGDYYSATGLTTSATDGTFVTVACTFYWAGGSNLQHLVDLRLGTGGSDVGFYMWINGGRTQMTLVGGGSEYKTMYENAENSLTQNAWNQVVFYMQTNSSTNSKIFINGVSKAFTMSNLTANTFNWGNTATTITIGQKQAAITGTGADLNGRISQLYIHNANGSPNISSYWNSTESKPRDLGINGNATGLPQPLIYHYGTTSTFPTNRGTGFASYTLTANGGITNAEGPTYVRSTASGTRGTTASGQFDNAYAYTTGAGSGTNYVDITFKPNMIDGVWCVEFWMQRPSAEADESPCFGLSNSLVFQVGSSGYRLWSGDYSSASTFIGSWGGTAGTYSHYVLQRTGGVTQMFRNGSYIRNLGGPTDPTALRVGKNWGTNYGISSNQFYFDEIRVSNIARYTASSSYTVPTAPFVNDANTVALFHCNSSTEFDDQS